MGWAVFLISRRQRVFHSFPCVSFQLNLGIFDNRREPSLVINYLLQYIVKELIELEDKPITINGVKYYVRLWNILADDPGMHERDRQRR